MRVIVTGASGLLGRAVLKAFEAAPDTTVIGTAFSRATGNLVQLNLQDAQAVQELVVQFKPDVMVHCAAERRPDVAEQNPDAVRQLNVELPRRLSALSRDPSHPFFLIYISTDYVFPGNAPPHPKGYEPGDATGPTNLYGFTKLDGEKEILEGITQGGKGAILRVPVLYGQVEKNSESAVNVLLDLTRSAASGKKVVMDHWAARYPTNVSDIAQVLLQLSQKHAQGVELPSLLHFSAQVTFTKYEICQLLAQLHDPPLEIPEGCLVPMSDPPKPGETIRPKDCHLTNNVLESIGINTNPVDFQVWWKEWLQEEKRSQ